MLSIIDIKKPGLLFIILLIEKILFFIVSGPNNLIEFIKEIFKKCYFIRLTTA